MSSGSMFFPLSSDQDCQILPCLVSSGMFSLMGVAVFCGVSAANGAEHGGRPVDRHCLGPQETVIVAGSPVGRLSYSPEQSPELFSYREQARICKEG